MPFPFGDRAPRRGNSLADGHNGPGDGERMDLRYLRRAFPTPVPPNEDPEEGGAPEEARPRDPAKNAEREKKRNSRAEKKK